MEHEDSTGRRIREIRLWRGLALRTVAELAGISFSNLGKIERGERPVNNRLVLEALATALRVTPSELTGRPWTLASAAQNQPQAALVEVEAALTEWWPGEAPDGAAARAWPEVLADLRLLIGKLRPSSDYAGQGELLPRLLRDLLIYAASDQHRTVALRGLMGAYHAAANVAARLGVQQLAYIGAERVSQVAQLLDEPEWLGVAAWTRAHFISSISRDRQYRLAVAAAELPDARLESRGMSHLTAALAAAARGDTSTAHTHLDEAARMAELLDLDNSSWGDGTMNFGRANVGIWRVAIGVEAGDGAKVAEDADKVPWQAITISRQGAYWMELGRALLGERKTRDRGLAALLKAEELTPQQVQNNLFVRESIASLLRQARRDAGGQELRRLAWRMGVAPNG